MTTPNHLRTAIIIPLYNHGQRVRAVVDKARDVGWPVFVIDDGSTDLAPDLLTNLPGVTVLTHDTNQGKGAALMHGFKEAARIADWAVTIDADGQHDPAEARQFFKSIPPGQRPIIVGHRQGMDTEDVPWTSRWGRRFSNFWVWLSCGHWLSDSQSGFRLYPLPETIHLHPKARRFQFEVEILALAVWSGIPILEAPIRVVYQPRGERISHFKPGLDFWRNTKTFARLIVRRVFLPRSLRPYRA